MTFYKENIDNLIIGLKTKAYLPLSYRKDIVTILLTLKIRQELIVLFTFDKNSVYYTEYITKEHREPIINILTNYKYFLQNKTDNKSVEDQEALTKIKESGACIYYKLDCEKENVWKAVYQVDIPELPKFENDITVHQFKMGIVQQD
jgi:hypothetical protein